MQVDARKMVGYLLVIITGVGTILMSVYDVFDNRIAAILQLVIGIVFIYLGIKKIIDLQNENNE